MPNIEIKARYTDLEKARRVAHGLGATWLWLDDQEDTYFLTRAGKLKLRISRLNGAELLPYVKVDTQGLKRSDYARIPVHEPELVKSLFQNLLGQQVVVRKRREVFLVGNIRVHLDEVDRVGTFLELEAVFEQDTPEVTAREEAKVRDLMDRFEIRQQDLVATSYVDLLTASAAPPTD